jgi:hypothetical protein
MPIDIIDGLRLGSDIPLDVRYTANTYWDVSAYWYEGMQVYQYTDKQIWYFDGSTWSTLKQTGPINIDEINGGTNWTNPSGDSIQGGSY